MLNKNGFLCSFCLLVGIKLLVINGVLIAAVFKEEIGGFAIDDGGGT